MGKTEQVKDIKDISISVVDAEKIIKDKNFPSFEKLVGDKVKKSSDKLLVSLNDSLPKELIDTLTLDNINATMKLIAFLSPSLSEANKLISDKLLANLTTRKDVLNKQTNPVDVKSNVEVITEADKAAALELFEKGPEAKFESLYNAVLSKSKAVNLTGVGEQTPQEIELRKLVLAYSQIKGISPDQIDLRSDNTTGKHYIEVKPKGWVSGDKIERFFWKGEQIQKATEVVKGLSLKGQLSEQFKNILNQFGSVLLTVFEFLGGKGKFSKLLSKIPEFKKLYDDVYQLNSDQKTQLDAVYAEDETKFSSKNAPDQLKIQAYYREKNRVESNFHLLDPVLVDRAMLNNPSIAVAGLVVPSEPLYGESRYKLDPTVLATCSSEKKQAIVDEIFKDGSFWNNVNSLNGNDVATSVYGEESAALWNDKAPKSAKDYAVVAGACLMKGSQTLKYVISQTDMPYQADHKNTMKEQAPVVTNTTEITAIEKDWTSFLDKCNGVWKDYPLATEPTTPSTKKTYDEYKTAISTNLTKLLNPNNKDLSTLSSKDTLKPFLEKHINIYLNSLKLDKNIYIDPNNKVIDNILSIKTDLVIDVSATGISIAGKDAASKEIKVDSSSFGWLPKKEVAKV